MPTRISHTVIVLLVLEAFGLVALPRAQTLTADDIATRYLQALGGSEALAKLTSRRAAGTVLLSTPNGDIAGTVEALDKLPNKSRLTMSLDLSSMGAGLLDIVMRFDGTSGMMSNRMQGDTEITGAQLDNMRNTMFPTPFLHYKENGTTLTLLPKDTVEGKPVLVVQAKPKVGPVVTVDFDPETFLVVRTLVHVNAATGGEQDEYEMPSDYREVSGVKVPFKIVNFAGDQRVTIEFTKVEHNVAIDDAVFSR